jgi:hypothetical protein
VSLWTNTRETVALSGIGGLLILANSWPAFRYYFFAEDFTYLRLYNQHHRHLWEAAFSLQDSMFFRPGFLLGTLVWHFILPPDPMYYHIRNFIVVVVSLALVHRVLLKLVQSRAARTIALLFFASSKMFLSIIGYINLYEVSILLITTLLTLIFWLRYIEHRRTVDYFVALAFCLLCSYAKEIGFLVIAPMAILVAVLAMKRGDMKGQAGYWGIRYLPVLVIAASYLILRYILTGPIPSGNPTYSPQLSLSVASWQTKAFLATVGNFALTDSGAMGNPGLTGVFARDSTAIEATLCAALWALILFTMWRGRSAWRFLILPVVLIPLYLSPTFLIRNHQIHYYQESLVAMALLIGICLDRSRPLLLTVWFLVVVLVAANGFVANRRSYYNWQYSADFVEKLKPRFEEWQSNPPASVTFVSPPEFIGLARWALRNPLTQQLTGHPITVRIVQSGEPISPDSLAVDVRSASVIGGLTTATGAMTANPNPISVCDGSGLGVTTVSWIFQNAKKIEIHVGNPKGDLFAQAEGPGQWATTKWVADGMVFYMQDVSDGRPLAAEYTITALKVGVTNAGCR